MVVHFTAKIQQNLLICKSNVKINNFKYAYFDKNDRNKVRAQWASI